MNTDTFNPSDLDLLHLRNTAEAFINSKTADDAVMDEKVSVIAQAYMTALAYEYFTQNAPTLAQSAREAVLRNFTEHESYGLFLSALRHTGENEPSRKLVFFVQFMMLLHTELCRDRGLWAAARDHAIAHHGLNMTVGYGRQ
jgi:hypothetical protein